MGVPIAYAWYRFRSTLKSELLYLLSVVLLVGGVGGLALGAIEAARGTESSFADLVTSSHVPQLFVFDGVINPGIGLDSAYNPGLLRTLSHLPDVERVESTVELNMGPLTPNGQPLANSAISPTAEASVGGLDFTEDPLEIVDGRMVDPRKADEVVIDAASAKTLGYHLGEVIPVGWETNAQTSSGNFNPNQPIPVHQRATLKIVGIAGGQATTLFQDQDNANGQSIMLFAPALTNNLLTCCSNDMVSALTLQGGNRHLSAVEAAVKRALPKGLPFVYQESQSIITTANATLRPETIALNVFGGITGIAALLIAGQVISRRVRLRAPELDIARALGADPSMCLWDSLLGSFGALLLGSLLAGTVAVGLSPLGPLGPVRSFVGVALRPDWTVIGIGVLTLVVVLGGVAVLASLRALPDRVRNRASTFMSSRVTTAASRAGLPPAAVTGVRFALEPGVGRSAVPVRSAILGAILAVTVVVATVTFGSSLNTLVSHPALYGWNWNYDMDGGGGLGDIPGQAAAKLLDADPLVQSWTGVYYSALTFDGVNVPVMGATPGSRRRPASLERSWPAGVRSGGARRFDAAHSAQAGRGRRAGTHPRRKPGHAHDRGNGDAPTDRRRGLVTSGDGNRRRARLPDHPARGTEPLRSHARAERHPGAHEGRCQPSRTVVAAVHRPPGGHRHQRWLRVRGAPSRADPQLRVARHDALSAGWRPGGRGRGRARHHAGDFGPPPPP